MDKAILTCALTGVLTDPAQHPVPVTAAEMAAAARQAFDAGASVMHVHLRRQEPGMGRFPSWDPAVAAEIDTAIRAACPGVIINLTTGVVGPDIAGPSACIRAVSGNPSALARTPLAHPSPTTEAFTPIAWSNASAASTESTSITL